MRDQHYISGFLRPTWAFSPKQQQPSESDSLIAAETIRAVVPVGLMEANLQCNKYTESPFVNRLWIS